jgi:Mn2+/Fe2+ NRAMP family transporter
LAALIVWAVVVQGTYGVVEKVFLSASAFYVAYIVSGVFAHPDWKAAALSTVTRPESAGFRNYGYLSMIIGLAGTTIAPWMQFYLQGVDRREGRDREAVQRVAPRRDHRLRVRRRRRLVHRRRLRGDAALDRRVQHRNRRRRGQALRPLAGEWAYLLFAAGLFNASLFAASILPISTAYAVCEGLGLESGLDKRFEEAPAFYWLYTALIVLGAGWCWCRGSRCSG